MSQAKRPGPKTITALKWLIRITGVGIALGPIFIGLCLIRIPIGWITRGLEYFNPHDLFNDFIKIILASLVVFIFAYCSTVMIKIGFNMARRIDASAVSDFAFLLTFLSLYVLMQWHLLHQFIDRSFADHPTLRHLVSERGANSLVMLFSYGFIWYFYRTILLKIFGLRADGRPPRSPHEAHAEIPEFPKKSPLIQL